MGSDRIPHVSRESSLQHGRAYCGTKPLSSTVEVPNDVTSYTRRTLLVWVSTLLRLESPGRSTAARASGHRSQNCSARWSKSPEGRFASNKRLRVNLTF